MSFNRGFFKTIADLLQEYYKVYPCSAVTLTLQVGNQEYNVAKILKCDEDLLTFSYFSAEKSYPIDKKSASGETVALPALTVPYMTIFGVEFNPRKAASEREIGFTAEKD
ncbi:MAG: hypothetical protein A3F68_08920 [Acidobacteria bacterium RIFCSPLOWO2_12_FULL_54_10]|nr:MAG: hypothetical protein A3F68_08920 [Acidobacteria bacterium RIFCSPLOWO2_12_FULL_54_10]